MKPTDLTDVLDRARAGDDRAIARLYRSLHPALLRYLRHQVGDAADDVASETWLAAARGLPSFVGDVAAFRGWLFTIARRRVVDHHRSNARRPRLVAIDHDPTDLARVATDDAGALVVDRIAGDEAVEALTRGLPEEQAEVLLLRVVAGLTVDQVATATGRSAGAVRMLQHRALQKLQKIWPDRDAAGPPDD